MLCQPHKLYNNLGPCDPKYESNSMNILYFVVQSKNGFSGWRNIVLMYLPKILANSRAPVWMVFAFPLIFCIKIPQKNKSVNL